MDRGGTIPTNDERSGAGEAAAAGERAIEEVTHALGVLVEAFDYWLAWAAPRRAR